MSYNEDEINNRYKNTNFINNPNFESDIKILIKNKIKNETPFFSIVIPIYNQEKIIKKNIESILKNTSEKYYELIIILDCCSDNSEEITKKFIQDKRTETYPLLTNIIILKSEIPLFETSADNVGFYCSQGQYILEIQADMEMTEYGYNMRLLKPFLLNKNIIGISGRCCHSYDETQGVGKMGRDITKSLLELNIDRNAYYIGETCNRGPLLLDHSKLKELNYLDEKNFFLDNSDHDLFARAYFIKKWECGYVPIDYNSPLEDGSTRKQRDPINEKYYNIKKQITNNGKNGFLNNHSLKKRDIVKINL
jgi:glycosyltransferase involved in cell wall biosynthesis